MFLEFCIDFNNGFNVVVKIGDRIVNYDNVCWSKLEIVINKRGKSEIIYIFCFSKGKI